MIALLKGKIIDKDKDSILLLTSGGVGYQVRLSPLHTTHILIDEEVEMSVYLRVTDSSMDLYGFHSVEEKRFFELLMSVSGVGPKSAMNILALGSIEEIQSAIARSDVKYLTAVQGMGKKTAERLVVELKNKVTKQGASETTSVQSGILADVIDGLLSLGYSKEEAKTRVEQLDTKNKTPEELLKEALKK